MSMQTYNRWSAFALVATLLTSMASAETVLPSGARMQVRLTDYVNTEHQALAYSYRGVLEGDVTAGDKGIASDKSTVLMRLVSHPGAPGNLTLELWAIKAGDVWYEFRRTGGGSALFTVLKDVEDRRPPGLEQKPVISRGNALYIPSQSILHFEIAQSLLLVNVGRYRR